MLAKSRVVNRDSDFSLAETPDGDIWLGEEGISKVGVHRDRLDIRPETVPKANVPDIEYDAIHRTLWACDGNDLLYRKDGSWGRITPKDGLLSLGCRSIGIQANGDVWLGYDTSAFALIGNPSSGHPGIQNYTQWLNDTVANDSVHFLSVDQRGWLWRGMNALYLATPEAVKAGEWLRLDEEDGLSPPEVFGHPFLNDSDGSVWFGTDVGIAHFSPPHGFATNFPSPSVFVAGFSLGRGLATFADAIGAIPHGADLVAHIGSMQFDRRNALRLRYRLLPEQSRWTYTNNLNLHLGKLHWGHHALQVQGQLATGPWSAVSEQFLTVLSPMWLSWPALLLMGAGGTGLGLTAARWKKHQRFKREAVLPDMTAWRMSALSPETQESDRNRRR